MSGSPRTESSTLSVDLDFPKSTNLNLRNAKSHYGHHDDEMPPSLTIMHPHDDEPRPYCLVSKLVAEFIGDMIFVFIGSLTALGSGDNLLRAAFGHGITIFVLVASLGHVSGGHFNPAVTLSVALSRKMKLVEVPLYWAAQLGGGFVGALWVRAILKQSQYDAIEGGATLLSNGYDWYQGLIAEFMLTFILCQSVLMTAVDTSSNLLAPLAIGLTLTLDICAAGTISGASMNPARSFGPCLADAIFRSRENGVHIWEYHYIYWAGPFLGAALASGMYQVFFSRGHNRLM